MLINILEIFLGVLGLSMVVLVHEAGHLFAARLMGIRVETFSVGFGRRIVGFRRGETEYRLSLIPLGGYCRFYGEQSFREALVRKLDAIPSRGGEFYGSAPWKRIIVCFAGPLANVIFAVVVFTAIAWIGYQEQYTHPRIILLSEYSEDGRIWPADLAGLKSGDMIVEVDGVPIDRFEELRRRIALRPRQNLQLVVDRNGCLQSTQISPSLDKENGRAVIGVLNWIDPVLEHIVPESAAYRAGLRPGDRILSLSSVPVPHITALNAQLELSAGRNVEMRIERAGEMTALTWNVPKKVSFASEMGMEFRIRSGRSVSLGFMRSLLRGTEETGMVLISTIRGIRMMFMGIRLRGAVAGPIRLIFDTGAAVTAGFRRGIGPGLLWGFQLMSLISVSLGFINLLPIPVLDGGQIMLFTAEIVRRRPLNPNLVYRYQFIGTIIVTAIAIAATASDFLYFRGR